ncbi:hypothetical protein AVEN_191654-1 [Araneus ventricosus]|uniref:Uncharacterized protein n=1 Tax=Araneus ventricosus TaxID=182803 RepID=A0A4Y2TF13_ARAVE|nr:hypothetical protein AVEN_41964-1 [Araneus ventricosus]GBN98601.1 hypothetical protein AVEN_191654-1 [Araneus ventricosus]
MVVESFDEPRERKTWARIRTEGITSSNLTIFNPLRPIPPQTASFDTRRTQAVSGAWVNFTEKISSFVCRQLIVQPRMSSSWNFCREREDFMNENLLQFQRVEKGKLHFKMEM